MAAQTEFTRGSSFTDAQAAAPGAPPSGPALDAEFDRVKISLDSTQQSLDLIQRDDGALANNSVGIDQIDPAVYAGLRPATQWAAPVSYVLYDTVFFGTGATVSLYRCLASHTSSIFANDLAAGRWLLLFDYTPPVTVGVTPLANGGTGASDAAGARVNLGLGPLATAASVAVNQGGTGAVDAPGARANLGLAIGADVLAYDAKLAAEAALSPIADRLSFYTGTTTKNTTPFPSSARSLLSLAPAADRLPYFSGSSTAALTAFTAAARALLDDPDAATMLTTLGFSAFVKTLIGAVDVAAFMAVLGSVWTIGASGSITLPGGLVVKWGTTGAIAAGGGNALPFPVAFPNACFGLSVTPIASANNTNAYSVGYRGASASGVTITNNSGTSGSVSAFWLAFGN